MTNEDMNRTSEQSQGMAQSNSTVSAEDTQLNGGSTMNSDANNTTASMEDANNNANDGTTNEGGSMATHDVPQQDKQKGTRKEYDGSKAPGVKVDDKFSKLVDLDKALARVKLRGQYLKGQYAELNGKIAAPDVEVAVKTQAIADAETVYTQLTKTAELYRTLEGKRAEVEAAEREAAESYSAKSTDDLPF